MLLLADDGHLGAAAELGEHLLAEAHDPAVLKVLSRVYWERWQETDDEAWHDRWCQINVLRDEGTSSQDEGEASLAPTSP